MRGSPHCLGRKSEKLMGRVPITRTYFIVKLNSWKMKKENQIVGNEVSVNPLENIENLILNIRDKQVMLDRDLARLYGVETKVLNQAVKRNIERFPEDFMFQLNKEEFENWKSQIVTSNWMSQNASSNSIIMATRKLPYA